MTVRRTGIVVAALLAVALATVLSLSLGARPVAPAELLEAWTRNLAGDPDQAVVQARLSSTVLALLVGGALGIAGAAMQGVARNPLADPGILGVNAGAALAVVVAIAWLGVAGLSGYLWFSFAGAAVAAVLRVRRREPGPRGCDPDQAGSCRCRRQRRSRVVDERGARHEPGRVRPLPLLAGRVRRWPGLAGRRGDLAVPRHRGRPRARPSAEPSTGSPSATTPHAGSASTWSSAGC